MTATTNTFNTERLTPGLQGWRTRKSLRLVYEQYFELFRQHVAEGSTLEIGSGLGIARDKIPNLTLSDVEKTEHVNKVVSAYSIKEDTNQSWNNIILLDVLHHLKTPFTFFKSAAASLQPGGRILITDPACTLWSHFLFSRFHEEPITPETIPEDFDFSHDTASEFANMAMAEELFSRRRAYTAERLKALELKIVTVRHMDFLAYPLTGGFTGKKLAPCGLIRAIHKLESLLPESFYKRFGMRIFIVLEKTQ